MLHLMLAQTQMPRINPAFMRAVGQVTEELDRAARAEQYKRDPVAWARDALGKTMWSKQQEILYSLRDNQRTAVRSCNNAGKDLPLDTPLPTPTGWTTMGEVQVGDLVLDEDGNPTRVTAKSEVFHNPLYELEFSDGARVVCSDGHLWSTIDFATVRTAGKHVWDYRNLWDLATVRDTGAIRETLYTQHVIPTNRALNLPHNRHTAYLRGSIEQRADALDDLVETYGVSPTELVFPTRAHTDHAAELIRTLGFMAHVDPHGYKVTLDCEATHRTIAGVKRVPTVPTQCITVDSPRSLYLATEWFIPTHNTSTAGVAGSWFIATNDPRDTIVVCTAPAFAQIKTNLFHEFQVNIDAAKLRGNPLPGYLAVGQNIAEWKTRDGTQLALGRRPPDKDAVTSFMGIHRANVLVILDEAGGTPPELFTLAERITTTGNARILAIGNPDRLGSEFHRMFGDGSDWNQIHINGLETPNFTDEGTRDYPLVREYMEANGIPFSTEPFPAELRKYMLQVPWAERQMRVWGTDDARFKVSILGDFPDADDSVFFPRSIIDASTDVDLEIDNEDPLVLGVDLARMGEDSSVIYSYQSGKLRYVHSWSKADAVTSANIVHKYATDLGAAYVNVDAGGLGAPIIDNILTMGGAYNVVSMNGNGTTPDKRRWLNARAWWYDTMRERMALRQIDLDIEDTQLIKEMGDINYSIDKGPIQIESKKELKKRSGASPDHLDAAVYACYDPVAGDGLLNPVKKAKVYEDPETVTGSFPGYLTSLDSQW